MFSFMFSLSGLYVIGFLYILFILQSINGLA